MIYKCCILFTTRNIHFFSEVLKRTKDVTEKGVIEFGCNIGLNLMTIRALFLEIDCAGVEINKTAVAMLKKCSENKGM